MTTFSILDNTVQKHGLSDEDGKFTVRSCYKWLQGEHDNTYSQFWKKLWSLRMPGKVVNFVWRVCKGCLPTAGALLTKRVNISDICPWCHTGKETDMHVLFYCDFAKTVWQLSGCQVLNMIMPDASVFEVMRRMFDSMSMDQCIWFCLLCWSIWNRRNKWIWDKENGSAFGVKAAAMHLLQDWKKAHETQLTNQSGRLAVVDKKWRKPPDDWLKVNVDATGACNGYVGFG